MYKVKFPSTKLPERSVLIYGVSKDNDKQTGNNFQSFIDWIVENKNKVSELKIVLSDWLHRFYVGDEEALLWGKKWEEDNGRFLNKLNKVNIPYQLIHWKAVIETESFTKAKLEIKRLFNSDEGFIAIVKGLANNHKQKAGFTEALNYLLEESAGIGSFEGILTYPANELNGAVSYALKKLHYGPIFIGHMLVPPKARYNPQQDLCQLLFKAIRISEEAGYKSKLDKMNFFSQSIEAFEKNKDFSLFSQELTTLQSTLPG